MGCPIHVTIMYYVFRFAFLLVSVVLKHFVYILSSSTFVCVCYLYMYKWLRMRVCVSMCICVINIYIFTFLHTVIEDQLNCISVFSN